MSTHTGVSCDACMISNFPGRRYKCLVCVNYDLCGTCYDAESESQNHKNNHPMQCILTEAAAEIFYSGEPSANRSVSSLTCPYCAQAGFIARTLLAHCVEKHSAPSIQSKTDQVVMCPICVTSPTHRSRTRFTLLADHIATAHDDGSLVGGDDLLASPFTTQTQRNADEEEDSDEEEADEDEEGGLTLNDHDHQVFIESEQRRQEIARQRLIHASSAAAAALNSNSNNSNTQRRPLSRQTAIRIARGSFRNHFNHLPYGSSSRGGGNTLTSSTSSRNANDSNTTTNPQTTPLYDPFAPPLGADPMLDYVSQLLTNQTSTTGNWSFLSPFPVQQPTSTNPNVVDYTRLQQTLDTGENANQTNSLRASLLNAKQKRTSQNQQQSSSPQTVLLGNTSGQDLSTWQQQLSNLQRTMNLTNVFGDNFTLESNANQNSIVNPNLKHVQQCQRDSSAQSLLEKMLKCELTVNKDEKNEPNRAQQQQQNRLEFIRSILLSSMTISENKDKDENQSTFDKENQL